MVLDVVMSGTFNLRCGWILLVQTRLARSIHVTRILYSLEGRSSNKLKPARDGNRRVEFEKAFFLHADYLI